MKTYMRIDCPEGTKVILGFPDHGYPHDQEMVKKHLKVGETYTVERTVIHNFNTDVYLKEIPGVPFNSVLFEEVENEHASS